MSASSKDINIDGDTFRLIANKLPQYQFEIEHTNTARTLELLKTKANVCSGNKLMTPARAAYSVATTIPQLVVPGMRLYAHKNLMQLPKIKQLASEQTISLEQVLTILPQARFAVTKDRTYGEHLDQLINTPQFQPNFYFRSSASNEILGLLQMLSQQRIDFIIEYPNVFAHYQQTGELKDNLVSFELAHTPASMKGYILCSKSPLGQQVIADIDQALFELKRTEAYHQAILKWIEPSAQTATKRYYNQAYGTQFPETDIALTNNE